MTARIGISVSSFAEGSQRPLERLAAACVEVVPNPLGRRLTAEEAAEFLADKDGLIAGLEPLGREVLERGRGRLRAIARVGIGVDNVDLEAARDLGVSVSNTPDAPTDAVAEMTLAALLCIERGIARGDAAIREGRWARRLGRSLNELTILCVGHGRIGRRVASLFASLGARVLVHDPAASPPTDPAVEPVSDLLPALAAADVISLHASGRKRVLGPEHFAAIKQGAVLLNSARAELCEESEVVSALQSGRLSAVWLDVFWEEPYRGPLVAQPGALLTPHIGTHTSGCRTGMELAAVDNLLRDLGLA